MVKDGEYLAQVMDSGFLKTKAGKEMAFAKLKVFVSETETTDLTWWGSLNSGRSQEFVLSTFRKLNPEIKNWDDILDGKVIRKGTEVKATLKNEAGQNGETFLKVSYLNPVRMTLNPKYLSFLKRADQEDEDLPF